MTLWNRLSMRDRPETRLGRPCLVKCLPIPGLLNILPVTNLLMRIRSQRWEIEPRSSRGLHWFGHLCLLLIAGRRVRRASGVFPLIVSQRPVLVNKVIDRSGQTLLRTT